MSLEGGRLARFDDVKVKVTYQKLLQAEVLGFGSRRVLARRWRVA